MMWAAPPDRFAAAQSYPGWEETAEARSARYRSIAEDLQAVAYDPAERPLFAGKRGRARTAALLLALALKESGLAPDTDRGPCYRGRDGRNARCDSGRSACMLQIRVGKGTTPEGWTKEDLFADRRKCFRAGLHLARRSVGACSQDGPDFILNAYASGVCGLGHQQSRERVALAERLFVRQPVPADDALTKEGLDASSKGAP
ncbi:hypothetical protein A7982_13867 [Minicystis rosea]|nr:hypothetical protein A7982_13867 [Minicystis rosea]